MFAITFMSIALLDELLFRMKCRQLDGKPEGLLSD